MSQHTLERPGAAGVRPKEFHFPLSVAWLHDRRVTAHVAGKRPIEVTAPPEFQGVDPSTWSPEDFFVAAAASCLAVTFTGLAERAGLAYTRLCVNADGTAGLRGDGRFGFTRLVLQFSVEVAGSDRERAYTLAEKAEAKCLVSASLDLPVETEIEVLAEGMRWCRAPAARAWRSLVRALTTPATRVPRRDPRLRRGLETTRKARGLLRRRWARARTRTLPRDKSLAPPLGDALAWRLK
jgi:organic hydroperoxide reductase OsmC/OhrA